MRVVIVIMMRNDSFFTRVAPGKQNQTQGHDHHAGCDAQPWIKTLWDNILRSVECDHAEQIDPGRMGRSDYQSEQQRVTHGAPRSNEIRGDQRLTVSRLQRVKRSEPHSNGERN